MFLLLLTLTTLGVANAENLFYAVQQQEQQPSEDAISQSNSLACPDRKSTCAGTASCCRTLTGTYRCCTYPNDVCCSDGHSCCPRGTICDLLNRRCISGFETEKWETVRAPTPASLPSEATPAAVKLPAKVVAASGEEKTTQSPIKIVPCDSHVHCQDGQTCCWLPEQRWGCCPLPFANCCTGSHFCCPNGKQCSNPAGYCY